MEGPEWGGAPEEKRAGVQSLRSACAVLEASLEFDRKTEDREARLPQTNCCLKLLTYSTISCEGTGQAARRVSTGCSADAATGASVPGLTVWKRSRTSLVVS